MFNPLFIKTPEGNFINLVFIHAIRKIDSRDKFLLFFLKEEEEDSYTLEFSNEEERDEFCNRIENLICPVF